MCVRRTEAVASVVVRMYCSRGAARRQVVRRNQQGGMHRKTPNLYCDPQRRKRIPLENIVSSADNRELSGPTVLTADQGATTKEKPPQRPWTVCHWRKSTHPTPWRYERFRWTPVRRVSQTNVPGHTDVLTDKLLQEVIRMILAY